MPVEIGQAAFEQVDVASASTVDLSAVVQWKVRITGTTNINTITMKADQILFVTFAGALTLASGIGALPNGANSITTAAGDTCILTASDVAAVTMWNYQRKGGTPVALVDPNADRIAFWDDSAGAMEWLALSGLTISGTTLSVNTSSEAAAGVVELASNTETVTGTDNSRAVHPAGLTARLAAPGAIGGTTPGAGTFTALTSTGNTILGDAAGDTIVMNAESITKPNAPAVFAYNSSTDSNVTGNNTAHTCIFDTEIYDRSNDYNNANGVYTAPVAGPHNVTGSIVIIQSLAGATHVVNIVASNRTTQAGNVQGLSSTVAVVNFAAGAIDMDAGDTLSVTITVNGVGADTADFFGVTDPRSHLEITHFG